MGHTSKFTFPLPGRKQKFHSKPPVSKVQKILGTSEISTDTPAPSGRDRPWGDRSGSVVSGISISISESTTSPSEQHGTGLGIIDDGTEEFASAARGVARSRQWEEESGVMPPASRAGNMAGADGFDDRVTDASSLHRRQSNSTIVTYYDKTKLPLSISQQTSNSAMAKGLPPKAKALLDMDGDVAPPPKPKKKPAKLDLSHLMPKSRLSRYSTQEIHTQKPLVLGPDLVTRSPSFMSISPDITPPLVQQRADRPGKRSARDTLKALLPTVSESSPSHRQRDLLIEADGLGEPSRSSVNLHNLYEHYERRTMQDAMEEPSESGMSPANSRHRPISPNHLSQSQEHASLASPTSSATRGFLSPFARITQRSSRSSRQASPSTHTSRSASSMTVSTTRTESPSNAALAARQVKSGSSDCGASISSRHTRTSKASRQTDRSIPDLDLQMNSVLSLSSDSEDDAIEPEYKPELPAVKNKASRTVSMPPRSRAAGADDEGRRAQGSKDNIGAVDIHDLFPIPDRSAQSLCPPKIVERSSSLAPASMWSKTANSLRPGRRQSSATRATGTVQSVHPRPASRGSLTSIPEKNFPARNVLDTRASLQPTPPLSPANQEFYRSEGRASSSLDTRSVHSGRSVSAASMRSKPETNDRQETSSGRFMAVTRQEEMLLAALRQKRAQIRENIIAELEEEQERVTVEQILPHVPSKLSRDHTSSMSRHSSRSTIRGFEAEHPGPQIQSKGSRSNLVSTQARRVTEFDSTGSERGQILLMLDRPDDDVDALDAAEPSPDLRDFLDFDGSFDDNSDGYLPKRMSDRTNADSRSVAFDSGLSYSTASRSVASLSGPSSSNASRSTSSHRRVRASLSAIASTFDSAQTSSYESHPPASATAQLHPKSFGKALPYDVHVKIVEDPLEDLVFPDVPRPDSPISPSDGSLRLTSPMPNKRREARLSAVGQYTQNVEVGWWDDDG